jgi:uncharacterized protein YqeY
MGLAERIQQDLTTAMKARDIQAVGTLRMVLAAIKNARVASGQSGEVSDEQTLELLTREAKKRNEAAEAYDAANRPELAVKRRDRRYRPLRPRQGHVGRHAQGQRPC